MSTLPHHRPSKERSYLYADKNEGVHPPAEDELGAIPHHADIHGTDNPAAVQERRGLGMSLNYLGMAALVTVIVWVILKDRLGSAKIAPGRGLPAHSKGPHGW